jgi:hypothetical protein
VLASLVRIHVSVFWAEGAVVLCLDNFFTGPRRNIEHLIAHPHFELIRHDVTFPLYVEVDQIYNLAVSCFSDSLPTRSSTNDENERAMARSSSRRCSAVISPFTATVHRPVRSAMSMV